MRLNNKGYMLVEIIISFTIAMGIAFYLMNLTFKFKNVNEDIYQSILYLKEKELITKNIMYDLEKGNITEFPNNAPNDKENVVEIKENEYKLKFKIDNEYRILKITKNEIEYGKINDVGSFEFDDSYYKKEIEKSLKIDRMTWKKNDETGIVTIEITMSSLYSEDDFNIKLIAQ